VRQVECRKEKWDVRACLASSVARDGEHAGFGSQFLFCFECVLACVGLDVFVWQSRRHRDRFEWRGGRLVGLGALRRCNNCIHTRTTLQEQNENKKPILARSASSSPGVSLSR